MQGGVRLTGQADLPRPTTSRGHPEVTASWGPMHAEQGVPHVSADLAHMLRSIGLVPRCPEGVDADHQGLRIYGG